MSAPTALPDCVDDRPGQGIGQLRCVGDPVLEAREIGVGAGEEIAPDVLAILAVRGFIEIARVRRRQRLEADVRAVEDAAFGTWRGRRVDGRTDGS
ncbi:MAG: hypothetical protein V9G24_18535 [Rhodoblastus sp.]